MSFGEFTTEELAAEEWRSIPELGEKFADKFQASALGRIRRANGTVPLPWVSPKGYLNVHIAGKHYLVHRLIATTFHGPCPDGCQTRHLDGNQRNNRAGNVIWGTPKANHDDKVIHHNRQPRIWRGSWVLWIDGQRINLGRDKAIAFASFAKIMDGFRPGEHVVIPAGVPRPLGGRPGKRGQRYAFQDSQEYTGLRASDLLLAQMAQSGKGDEFPLFCGRIIEESESFGPIAQRQSRGLIIPAKCPESSGNPERISGLIQEKGQSPHGSEAVSPAVAAQGQPGLVSGTQRPPDQPGS